MAVFRRDTPIAGRPRPARRTHGSGARRCSGRTSTAREILTREETSMDGNEHPKGALLFILIFLLLVVVFWINAYMRLWLRH
jgi:hypothetical protein